MSAIKTVWVAIYENEHGSYAEVFEDEADAWAYRDEIADDNWERELGDTRPQHAENLGELYFDNVNGEWFEVQKVEIHPSSRTQGTP